MKLIKETQTHEGDLLLKDLHHDNICKYYDHFDDKLDGIKYFCLILEYCEVNK